MNETVNTPEVFFNLNGILRIAGKSLPEYAIEYYKPLMDKLDEFLETKQSIEVTIEMIYINTSSSKVFYNILKKITESGVMVTVHWHYEEDDEDMRELGEYYEEMLEIPFAYQVFV